MHINGTVDVENGQPARTIERSRLLGLGTNEDPTALESDEYGIRNVYLVPSAVTKREWQEKYAGGPTTVVRLGEPDLQGHEWTGRPMA